YCSPGMHLLSSIISKSVDINAYDYAKKMLFGPLGITHSFWPSDPNGITFGWGDLRLLPKDMAKIGFLYLHKGIWDGKRILPEKFLEAATMPQTRTGHNDDYGYGWWISPNPDKQFGYVFSAEGRGGQQIKVVPKANAVVVMVGSGIDKYLGPIDDILGKSLISTKTALSENPQAFAKLSERVAGARQAPLKQNINKASTRKKHKNNKLPKMAKLISGKIFQLDINSLGLKNIRFDFVLDQRTDSKESESNVQLTLNDGSTLSQLIGMDGVPLFSNTGKFNSPVALSGVWQTNDTFLLELDEISGINFFKFLFHFEGKPVGSKVRVQVKERTGVVGDDLVINGKMK
ncbi:MAG: serine hydrolase, partial [Oligoflexia bacterium]|nr:serine hydrolase [Oligoflexia bacterium]